MALEKDIAKVIKEHRTALKMTQDELASKAGVDRGYISEIEGGKKNFTVQILEKIADGLGIPAKELICESGEPEKA